jgi:hypothetical protein
MSRIGFKVIRKENLKKWEIEREIKAMSKALSKQTSITIGEGTGFFSSVVCSFFLLSFGHCIVCPPSNCGF